MSINMKSLSSLLALTALTSAAPNPVQMPRANAAEATSTAALFLPPTPTNQDTKDSQQQNIWASVISTSASATEYLLACETAFASPSDCEGPYTGVTLTHGPATMGIELGGTRYACSHGEGKDAVCAIKSEDGPDEGTTLAPAEAEKWSTSVTVVAAEPTLPAEVGEAINAAKGGGRGGSSGGSSRKGGGGGGAIGDDDDEDGVGHVAVSWGVLGAALGVAALM